MHFDQPVPFYVAYPFTSFYDDEKTAQKDMDLMKSLYPEASLSIQAAVERECDRMEYDGSMMYDEYPDTFMVSQVCRRIGDKIKQENQVEEELLKVQESFRTQSTPLDDLVRILFCHEMFRRRCRRRRCRRYY